MRMFSRNRSTYIFLCFLTLCIGLISRYFSNYLPDMVNQCLGDALYGLMVYFLIGIFFKHTSILKVGLMALLFCILIEASQLYHAPWINAVRATRLGGLVFGYTFSWNDVFSLSAGVCVGTLIEIISFRQKKFS